MSEASAELMLVPKVNRDDLRRTTGRIKKAMGETAEKIGRELEQETEQGVRRGITRGSEKGLSKLKAGMLAVGATLGVAVANALGDADAVVNRMRARLEGGRDITREAGAFSVSAGQYAQAATVMTSLGYDNSDLRGMLSGYQAALKDPEMAGFRVIADKQGSLASMMNFIKSAEGMSASQRAARFGPVFGDEDSVIAGALLSNMSGIGNLQGLFQSLTGSTATASQIEQALERSTSESAKLSSYDANKYLDDLVKGGNAAKIIESESIDRRVNNAHDEIIDQKLAAKAVFAEAEIQSLKIMKAHAEEVETGLLRVQEYIQDPAKAAQDLYEFGGLLGGPSVKDLYEFGGFGGMPSTKDIIDSITEAFSGLTNSFNSSSDQERFDRGTGYVHGVGGKYGDKR